MRTDPIVPARTTLTVDAVRSELKRLEDRDRAAFLERFFKTGPGEYGEGDTFLGIRVPQLRALVRRCAGIDLGRVETLLHSPAHEERLLALLLMVRDYGRGDDGKRRRIYRLYLDNTRFINSWDLVDSSAEHIVGTHLQGKNRAPLYRLARSRSLWERRIAIMATYRYIKAGDFDETLRIAEMLLGDREDLIHKATGGCCARSASAAGSPKRRSSSARTGQRCRAQCFVTRLSAFRKRRGGAIWMVPFSGAREPSCLDRGSP